MSLHGSSVGHNVWLFMVDNSRRLTRDMLETKLEQIMKKSGDSSTPSVREICKVLKETF